MKRCFLLLTLLLSLVLASCHDDKPKLPDNKIPKDMTSQVLKEFNTGYADFEEDEVNRYIDSLHLDMKRENGLWFNIKNPGVGPKMTIDDKVLVRYTVSMLNGDTCPELINVERSFVVGDGSMRQGFDLAVRKLGVQGSGTFIVPALLAYGVVGFRDCVPSYTPVICDMTVIQKEKKQ